MIEQGDIDAAVTANVIDATTAARLIDFARDRQRGVVGPDEESFRLLTGFNDIFVTIAVGLVLFAIASLGGRVAPALGAGLVAVSSWALAEYFTRIRRMALPSIVLLLAFVGAVFATVLGVTTGDTSVEPTAPHSLGLAAATAHHSLGVVAAAAAAAIAAYGHWRRFVVPITVAAGAAALGGTLLATVAAIGVVAPDFYFVLILATGLGVFALAMHFDARDRARVTRWSDVAFWLHLLAAPAIIHPVFQLAGLLHGTPAPGSAALVIAVYVALTVVALAIDRRALLVSALGYVVYAIQSLMTHGGDVTASFALTALVIGGFLVLLSAAWRPIRARIIGLLPATVTMRLPVVTV